jgi:hypothetical protein
VADCSSTAAAMVACNASMRAMTSPMSARTVSSPPPGAAVTLRPPFARFVTPDGPER